MRLTFICSSLEPGRDGVGDYSRRLAAEFIRQGHACTLLALNETQLFESRTDTQEVDGTEIPVLRLSSSATWTDRTEKSRAWLAEFNPDWISLQFVAFGFHHKGLCFGLGKNLAAMNSKASWQVMFHELWLGLGENSPIKHRIWGMVQKHITLDVVRRLRPQIVNTQADPYRKVLFRQKISASILPLFGNVPFATGDGWTELIEPLIAKAIGKRPDRSQFYLAGVFGAVHPEWNAEVAVTTLLPLVQNAGKKLVIIFHGRNNLSSEALNAMRASLGERALVITTGERNSAEISRIFQTLDLGLATSPLQIIQKSGSIAAMLDHGLQILVTRDDWHLRGTGLQTTGTSIRVLSPRQFALLTTLPTRDFQPPAESSVQRVADRMLASFKSRSSREAVLHES